MRRKCQETKRSQKVQDGREVTPGDGTKININGFI